MKVHLTLKSSNAKTGPIPVSTSSIGYMREHTPHETLDLDYLERVIDRLIAVDWDGLTIARDLETEPDWLLDVEYELEEYSYRAGLL